MDARQSNQATGDKWANDIIMKPTLTLSEQLFLSLAFIKDEKCGLWCQIGIYCHLALVGGFACVRKGNLMLCC